MAFNQCEGRCIGRLMKFLYEYDLRSDECIFHGEKEDPMITLHGKPYANYTWDGKTDIPTFTFLSESERLGRIQAHNKPYLLIIEKRREEVFGKNDNEMDE